MRRQSVDFKVDDEEVQNINAGEKKVELINKQSEPILI
jgi:hypothetical protein